MAVYYVVRHNPYVKMGTYLETDYDDPLMVSPVEMKTNDQGHWAPYRQYGIVIPLSSVRQYTLRLQGRGLDDAGLKELRHGT